MVNKKGAAGVVTSILLVALSIVLIVVLWNFVVGLVSDTADESKVCLDVLGKVEINRLYTCYNSSATPKEFYFSVNIGNVEIDAVFFSISGGGSTKTYEIDESLIEGNLAPYGGAFNTEVSVPGKNSGKTYATNESSSKPDSITVKPIINGVQCDVSDGVYDISNC